MTRSSVTALLFAISLSAITASPMQAQVIASFDLNGINGGQAETGTQYQTGYAIRYNASLTDWSYSGFHAIHALQVAPDNWALMVFSGGDPNAYTLDTPFSCNTLGTDYWVSFDIAPTVYVNGNQATRSTDQLRILVLNPFDQVVAFTDVAPGAWNGSQEFHQAYFSYTGDGTGDVRLRITTADPGSDFFAGAVDNIAFEASRPIPEPSTYALLALGLVTAGVGYRRLANTSHVPRTLGS